MSITVKQLAGRKDKTTGQEAAWKVTGAKMDAANYPALTKTTIKRGGKDVEVPQIPVQPSNVSYREFGTIEDVKALNPTKFDEATLKLWNARSASLSEAGVKAKVREMLSWDGQPVTFDGTNTDLFVFSEGKQSAVSQAAGSVLQKIDELEGLSVEEKLAAVMAELERLRG